MPDKIRPNQNQRSGTLPVDDEVEAVIVVPYILDPVSGQYIPQAPASAGAAGPDPISVKDAQTPSRTLKVDANGRIGVEIANFPASTEIANDSGNPVPVSGTVAISNPTTNPETGLAKETTLASVLSQLDDATTDTVLSILKLINQNTDTLETLLTTVRDEQHRRTDPLVAGSAVIGKVQLDQAVSNFTTSSFVQDSIAERLFFSSTGKVSLAAAGNFRVTLRNPAGSGKNVYLVRFAGFATAAEWASVYINPTNGLPASAARYNMNNSLTSPVTSQTELKADTDPSVALSGGTDTNITFGIPPNTRFVIELTPLIIPPGTTFGMNIPFTGAADIAISFLWKEVNA